MRNFGPETRQFAVLGVRDMPTFSFSFYAIDPDGLFSRTSGGTTTYAGPATADGEATLTDNAGGIDGQVLEDDNRGENATADVTVNGQTSIGSNVDAEAGWTLRDTVTGEVFEIVRFDVENGPAAGDYLLSEIPLVPGRVYETIRFDSNPSATIAGDPVFTYDDYTDGIVEGTDGDDVIDGSYSGDPHGDVVDGNDAPNTGGTTSLEFNWTDYADETNLEAGVVQNTGGINVGVSYTGPTGGDFSAEHTNTQYVAGGEPFNPNSAAYLFQDGAATDAQVEFTFSAATGSGFEDGVQNLSFRINDLDGINANVGGVDYFFQDILTVTAFDADGNEVPVAFTPSSVMTENGNTVTGPFTNTSESNEQGSLLVEIAGPVARVLINYDNGGNTQQAVYLTDLHFDAVAEGANDDVIQAGAGNDIVDGQFGDDQIFGEAGDDTLTGGSGSDTLDGGTGDDTLNVGSGDTATGGDGDDTFLIDQSQLLGGTITVTGGEGDETDGDTLDLTDVLVKGSIVYTNTDDDAGGLSGTATLTDGTIVNFSEIENIICFTSGTMIETPHGPRAIEALSVGDVVLTRDHGPQPIRWAGCRAVPARGALAPVRIATGALGDHGTLIVSPQHRMLVSDYRAQLYFGEDEVLIPAKALVGMDGVTRADSGTVTYHHILFDRHEIVIANGAASESYHPGDYSLGGLGAAARDELFAVFPELRSDAASYGAPARPVIRPAQARMLAA